MEIIDQMHINLNKPSFTLEVIKRLITFKHRRVNYDYEIKRIFKYRDDNNLMHCVNNKEDCCCRVFYSAIDLKIPFCDFPNNCARLLINKENGLLNELVNEICEERREEAKYWNFVKRDQE